MCLILYKRFDWLPVWRAGTGISTLGVIERSGSTDQVELSRRKEQVLRYCSTAHKGGFWESRRGEHRVIDIYWLALSAVTNCSLKVRAILGGGANCA